MTSDGKYGWLVVAGTFVVGFLTDGLIFSFGVLLIELLDTFNEGRAVTVIISSIVTGGMHLIGPIAGLLSEMYGCRVVVIVGSLISFVGFLSSVFVNEIYYLYITYGLLGGVGFGLMYLPASVCVIQHFEKKRSLANGISMCGSGIGTFAFTQITGYLLETYGWRGTLLIESGILLNGVVCGLIFVSPQKPIKKINIENGAMSGKPATISSEDLSYAGSMNDCDDNYLTIEKEGQMPTKQPVEYSRNNVKCDVNKSDVSHIEESSSSVGTTENCEENTLDDLKDNNKYETAISNVSDTKSEKTNHISSNVTSVDLEEGVVTSGSDPELTLRVTNNFEQNKYDNPVINPEKTTVNHEHSVELTENTPEITKSNNDTTDDDKVTSELGNNFTTTLKDNTFVNGPRTAMNGIPKVSSLDISDNSCGQDIEQCGITTEDHSETTSNETLKDIEEDKTTICKRLCDLSLLKDGKLVAFLLSGFIVNLAYTVPSSFLPDQAIESGMTKRQSYWLASSIGITNTISRIIIGWVADLKYINRVVLLEALLFSVGITTVLSVLMDSWLTKMVYACLFGFLIGGYISLVPVVLADMFGVDIIARSFGLLMFSVGISGTAATPFAGWLYDHTGNYVISFVITGSEFILGALVFLIPFIMRKCAL